MDEDTITIELRSAETVARRCIILATVLQRFSIDTSSQDDREGAVFDLREWLRTENLWEDATDGERAFFSRQPDDPEPPGGLDVALSAESLATVGWALGLHYSLAEDRLDKLPALIRQIPAPWERTEPWIAVQSLRSEPEIVRMREASEVWNWRLAIEPERRSSRGRELSELESAIQTVSQDAIAADLFATSTDTVSGFTIGGVAVTEMAPAEIADLGALTQERLIALNWICGFGDDWDNVPIDV